MKDVNYRIAHWRKLSGFNQTELAEKLGIKCNTYSQMERKGLISAERLFEMAKIFGVSPCYLFNETEPCREEAKTSIVPQTENMPSILNQPEIPMIKRDVFVVTKKEENLIKILRKLSKEDYNATMKFIEEMNRKQKN